ncbi:hypothetical protein [Polymorphospora sp. NPDC050346]|uniref:hypothetical protein n=1 Tax=Polymorphospora sp. NPDC050346 TaxID=3155780 RepID=UPI0033CC77F4
MAELLIIAWMAWYITKDVIYAAKGQIPPRKQIRLAEIKAGIAQPRYGFGGFMADLKDDAYKAATARRREKAIERAEERKAAREEAKKEAAGHAEAEKPAEAPKPAAAADPQPATVPDPAAGPAPATAAGPTPPAASNAPATVPDPAAGPAPATAAGPTPPATTDPRAWKGEVREALASLHGIDAAEWDHLQGLRCQNPGCACHTDGVPAAYQCRTCGRQRTARYMHQLTPHPLCTTCEASRLRDEAEAEQRRRQAEAAGASATPAPAGAPDRKEHSSPGGPVAPVIQMFPQNSTTSSNTNTTKENNMDIDEQPVAEVTGLVSAIAYSEGVSTAHIAHGSAEGFASSLTEANYGPGVMTALAAAQEASTNAGVLWGALTAKLREGLVVKEAYGMASDTGDKAHVVNE